MEAPLLESFWDPFAALPPASRYEFLKKLVTQLAPHECQQLGRLLPNVYCYNRDRLPDLPLELVLHIIEYLDPIHIIHCRRVNKTWNHLFSSDSVCGPILRRGFPADALLLRNPESIYYGKSETWAFENALSRRVFTSACLAANFHVCEAGDGLGWRYSNGSVAFFSREPHDPVMVDEYLQIATIDAETGFSIVSSCPLPARERIRDIYYSGNFVLICTSENYFYLFNVQKETFKKLQWPSMQYRSPLEVASDGDVFVLMYNTEVAVVHSTRGMYRLCESPFREREPVEALDVRAVSVDAKARKFTIIGRCPDNFDYLQYREYSIDTYQLISQNTIPVTIPVTLRYPFMTHPLCGPGIRRIYTQVVSDEMVPGVGRIIRVSSWFFDFNTNKVLHRSTQHVVNDAGTIERLFTWEDMNFMVFGSTMYTSNSGRGGSVFSTIVNPDGEFPRFFMDRIDMDKNGCTLVLGWSGGPVFGVFKGVHGWSNEDWREELKSCRTIVQQ